MKKYKHGNIKKWFSDDEKRVAVFGPVRDMVENGLVMGDADIPGYIIVYCMDGDNSTARLHYYDTVEEVRKFAAGWCEQ